MRPLPHDEISALIRIRREYPSYLLSRKRGQSVTRKTALPKAQLYHHPDLGLPDSRN